MKTQYINATEIKTVIETIPKGSFFTVDFIKKDGSARTMNCRTGVKSYLNPNPTRKKYPMPENQVTVFDVIAKGYRHFDINTTKCIKACGVVFEIK